jgi:hypothetical protein
MGLFTYFLLIPLATASLRRRMPIRIPKLVPPAEFIIIMWIVIFSSMILAQFSSLPTKSALAETREMFYALFIFGYTLTFREQPLSKKRKMRIQARLDDSKRIQTLSTSSS